MAIVDDVPEIRFDASHKVPTVTEEDVAIALRLALEGNRPEFFFITIPFGHPFYGRQFNQYKPQLASRNIAWKLAIRCRLDHEMLERRRPEVMTRNRNFRAGKRQASWKGLATALDFPKDNPPGSIIMSCESAKSAEGRQRNGVPRGT